MKTKAQVIDERPEFKTLIKAVIENIGMDSVEDVNSHGIDGGFNGFIYTRDTVAFFNRHKADIMKLAEEMADNLGEDLLPMIRNFGCLSSGQYPNKKPDYSQSEIAEALYNGKSENADTIRNAMAWFAAEEVCRMFED